MLRVERSRKAPEAWDELRKQDPRASLFLSPRWMTALTRAYPRYRPLYLIAREEGEVRGMIPLVRMTRLGLSQFLEKELENVSYAQAQATDVQ